MLKIKKSVTEWIKTKSKSPKQSWMKSTSENFKL